MGLSLDKLIGLPATIPLRGRQLQVGPIQLKHLGAIAAKIRQDTPNPLPALAESLKSLPPDTAKAIFKDVFADYQRVMDPPPFLCLQWGLNSPSNFAYLMRQLLEERYKGEFTEDELFREFMGMICEDPAGYGELLHQISETAGAGKLGEEMAAVLRKAPWLETGSSAAAPLPAGPATPPTTPTSPPISEMRASEEPPPDSSL